MRPDKRPWLLPALLALYVLPFPYFPAINSPNENSRLYQARAIVDDGSFSVDGSLRRFGPVGDLAHSPTGYYPNKAPGVSMLGAAVYFVARQLTGAGPGQLSNAAVLYLLRVFCCGVPTILMLYFLRPLLWRWSHDGDAADVALVAYALGSLAYTYGLLFFSHQLAAVCMGSGFLCLESFRERSRTGLLALGGLLAGCGVLTEYTAALAALPLGLYVILTSGPGLRRVRAALVFGLSSLPPQLTLLWYHKLAYGSPFRVGYQNNVSQQFQQWHAQGFMGVTTPTWLGLVGSFFSPAKGLFTYSPFLLLGLYGLWVLLRRSATLAPARLLSVLFVLYTAFTASFIYEAWGWTVGPRHVAPLAVFLAIPAAVGLAEARRRRPAAAGFALGLCVLSVVLTSLATITYPHFPEVFSSGFFEVTLPLLVQGFLPSNLIGVLFGSQALGWYAYFALWLSMVGFMFVRGGTSGVARVSALATCALVLLGLGLVAHSPSAEKENMLLFIQRSYRAQ